VRTVEFQTPVYERKILSFAQKVLTQDEWDTLEAVELMSLESEQKDDLELLEDGSTVKREQIVTFDDFEVQRITLKTKETWTVPDVGSYRLMMTIQGVLKVGGQQVAQEEAVFIPANCRDIQMQSSSEEPCVVLISQPCSNQH
jgi:mannose-6-phosphate isomerase class I